jgi:hypothetical protein
VRAFPPPFAGIGAAGDAADAFPGGFQVRAVDAEAVGVFFDARGEQGSGAEFVLQELAGALSGFKLLRLLRRIKAGLASTPAQPDPVAKGRNQGCNEHWEGHAYENFSSDEQR